MKRKIIILLGSIIVLSMLCTCIVTLSGCTNTKKLDKFVNKLVDYKLDIDDATAIGLGKTDGDKQNYLIKATKNTSKQTSNASDSNAIATIADNDDLVNTTLEKITLTKTKHITIGDKELTISQEQMPAKILKMKIAGDFIFMQLIPKDTPDDCIPEENILSDFFYSSDWDFYSYTKKTKYYVTTIIASIENGQIYQLPKEISFPGSTDTVTYIHHIQDDGLIFYLSYDNDGCVTTNNAIALAVNANDELIFRKVITNEDIHYNNIFQNKNKTIFVESNVDSIIDNIVYTTEHIYSTSTGSVVKSTSDIYNIYNSDIELLHFEIWENGAFRNLNENDNFVIKNYCGGYLLTVKNGKIIQSFKLSIQGNKLYCQNYGEQENKVVYEGKGTLSFTRHGESGYTESLSHELLIYCNCLCDYVISELSPTGTKEYKVLYDENGNFVKLETTRLAEYNGYSFVALQPIR